MLFGNKNHLVGLDIGSRSIKAGEVVEGKKGLVLKKFGMIDIPAGAIEDSAINDPEAVAEAIQQLHSFKTQAGKARFVHALRAWLPLGEDSQILEDEASLQKGAVRDALFEFAEVWREAESHRRDSVEQK